MSRHEDLDSAVLRLPFPEVVAAGQDSYMRWFAEKGKNGRVFVGHKGATPRRTNFQKYWRDALVKAKVDQSLHLPDLRHTGNTLSAHTGASLRELMARAGHSSSQAALGVPACRGGAQPCHR